MRRLRKSTCLYMSPGFCLPLYLLLKKSLIFISIELILMLCSFIVSLPCDSWNKITVWGSSARKHPFVLLIYYLWPAIYYVIHNCCVEIKTWKAWLTKKQPKKQRAIRKTTGQVCARKSKEHHPIHTAPVNVKNVMKCVAVSRTAVPDLFKPIQFVIIRKITPSFI